MVREIVPPDTGLAFAAMRALRTDLADEALGAGVTERAGEGASDLAGDAQGAAVFFRDIDGFDLVALAALVGVKPKQPFAGAVR